MEFDLTFDIVDNTTGEVFTRNKQCTFNTDVPEDINKIQKYVDCFIRGLKQDKSLALCISATRFHIPVQMNLF